MNHYSLCYSDPIAHATTDFWASSDHFPESSGTSNYGGGNAYNKANYSDEDQALLASKNPKRRTGRKKFRETRHPVYRGARRRSSGKWVSEVREPNKTTRIWLGTFPTAEMAARAHDVAAIALRGQSACLNFADSAWRLPIPTSSEAKDIQKAAAEAAEAFRPPTESERACCFSTTNDDAKEECANEMAGDDDVLFMDEEAVFGMPGLLVNMAEGMMVPPPLHYGGGLVVVEEEDFGFAENDVSLWSY